MVNVSRFTAAQLGRFDFVRIRRRPIKREAMSNLHCESHRRVKTSQKGADEISLESKERREMMARLSRDEDVRGADPFRDRGVRRGASRA